MLKLTNCSKMFKDLVQDNIVTFRHMNDVLELTFVSDYKLIYALDNLTKNFNFNITYDGLAFVNCYFIKYDCVYNHVFVTLGYEKIVEL